MPASYPTALVDQRLAELYERHRHLEAGRVARYYEPGRGYYRPDAAGDERDHFGVAFAEHSGEIHVAGDCDMPFALQSLSTPGLDEYGNSVRGVNVCLEVSE